VQASTTTSYDYIIAGTGAAGLALAVQLQQSTVAFNKILLIDKDIKNTNDRTWCYWTKPTTNWLTPIIHRQWNYFDFKTNNYQHRFALAPYVYNMVRGIDYYNYCINILSNDDRFEFVTAPIIAIQTTATGAQLITNADTYTAKHVFNSALRLPFIKPNDINYVQHFKGWVISTELDSFDTTSPVFMDFRVPQHNDCRFAYVIPFSATQALVEYTGFSPKVLPLDEYDAELKNYITNYLHIANYTIQETEYGEIPMYESDFVNPHGANVTNIGTAGGSSKPSTGYTFYCILNHTRSIVDQLQLNLPIPAFKRAAKYRFYDAVLMNVIHNKSLNAGVIFERLFKRSKLTSLLSFLCEESTLWQDITIMNNAQKWAFTKAAFKVMFSKK
jgi:lycopene beta-cyclase